MADPNYLKEYHLAQIKAWKAKAETILNSADEENRDNTEEELAEYKGYMGRIKESQVEVERLEDRAKRREQLEALGSVSDVASSAPVEVPAKSAGEAFVQSKEYKAIVDAARGEEGFPRFTIPGVEMKAAGDPALESGGNNSDAIAPQWFGLEAPGLFQYPVTVQNVMNVVQLTTGNSANYPIVTQRDINSFSETSEGADKSGADFGFDFATETVKKWTAFGGASEEMFQDAPTLVNYINTELGVMALQKEERAIIDALLLAATTIADGSAIAGTAGYDAILEAMTDVRLAGGQPNVVLINPLDWAALAATKAIAGTGDYFSGGPYAAPRENLWGGLREVQTPLIPQGVALVGDFNRGARLFRKGGLRVDSSNSHSDYFRKNLVAIRAEIRSVTGVTYPEYFVEAILGTS